MYIFNTLYIFR